jgi:hypothetical protein
MFRRTFAVMLSGLLLLATLGFQTALAQTKSDSAVERMRAKVQKIGVGANARVEVKLRDSTRVKGYISSADQDSFTVTDRRTATTQTLSYADASSVNKGGSGVSMKTWIILGAAAAATAVTWVIVKPAFCDGGAQTRGIC